MNAGPLEADRNLKSARIARIVPVKAKEVQGERNQQELARQMEYYAKEIRKFGGPIISLA